ncbi:hypothetical protein PSENEW3n2_00005274 [Picochlorum sp. SENEW3]|nr:hypothetical protein PSENEW3n2_00005274 [Picochlorum sp. SENEW3]WPT17269.1 hypothetical protein PSENEW3_00005274 [Picochlorum sp. SENEW3]
MKEYRVPFTEEQNFSSRVPRDMPHVKFTSDSGSLSKVLSTFHSGVDVIAIKCDSSQSVHDAVIEFRTYMMQDGGYFNKVAHNSLHTSLEFRSNIAFRSFSNTLGIPIEVAYNLKDFSSIVSTAENLGAPLTIICAAPGDPLLALCTLSQDVEIELILSTLPGEAASQNLRQSEIREMSVFQANEDGNPFDMATGVGEEFVTSPQESPFYSQDAPADRSSSDLEVDTRKLDAGLSRSTKELRILQQAPVPITADGKGKPQHSPRSLFEASAYRIAFHEEKARQELNKPEEDHHGLPQKFLEAYVNALKDGNTAWASNPEVADLFSDDVKMTGQDKKTTEGKPQVIRRLNKGIEMLVQMAGKDAAVPTWEIEGPNLTDKFSHEYKCTIRRGAMRVSFRLEFTIIRGKIAEFSNTRT